MMQKGPYGWFADDTFDLPEGRALRVTTGKVSSGKLVTRVSAGESKNGMFTYAPFSDYGVRVLVTDQRCTEANVRANQATALARLEEFKKSAMEHYAK